MQRLLPIAAAAGLVLLCSVVAGAADDSVTLDGNIVCAKCTLKIPDVDKCQTVLLAKNAKGDEAQFWLAPNAVTEAFGEVCTAVKPVTVTGRTQEKDGKKWIVPTKIDPRPAGQ